MVATAEPRITPHVCSHDALARLGMFDIILAHSVLCDHPGGLLKDRFDRFTFQRFSDVVDALDGVLRPTGVLSLVNASYCIEDTGVGSALRKLDSFVATSIPKFAPDGRKISQTLQEGHWIVSQIDPADQTWVRDRMKGSLFSRSHAGPIIGPAILTLRPEDLFLSNKVAGRNRVPHFVDVRFALEIFEVPSTGGLGSRIVMPS